MFLNLRFCSYKLTNLSINIMFGYELLTWLWLALRFYDVQRTGQT
jgi:hypothetical protein